jgi:NurA-like 5'-3' nuclease
LFGEVMRIEILEKAKRLRDEFRELTKDFDKEIAKEEVRREWVEYIPKSKKVAVCAEDGSINVKNYLGYSLYVVSGYAVCMREDEKEEVIYKEKVLGEINLSVIKKHKYLEAYLRTLMFLVELKALIQLAKETRPEILLLDGTLSSKYITIFPKSDWFTEKEFEGELANTSIELLPIIENKLFDYDITAFSKDIKELAIERLKSKGIEPSTAVLEATLAKIAYFEYLLLLHQLFYKLDWNPLILGIAKTSNLTEIFKKSVPDIRIFYKYTDTLGYSKKVYVEPEQLKWEHSEIFQEREKDIEISLRDIHIFYFYAKYQSPRSISLIEVYENPELERIDIEEILDFLNYLSVNGYPFILKKADREARITNKDLELIEHILGLQNEVSGREGLE